MKVKDLIKVLVDMSMEAEVWCSGSTVAFPVEAVRLSEDNKVVSLRKLSI